MVHALPVRPVAGFFYHFPPVCSPAAQHGSHFEAWCPIVASGGSTYGCEFLVAAGDCAIEGGDVSHSWCPTDASVNLGD